MLDAMQRDDDLPAAIRPMDDEEELPSSLLVDHADLPFEEDGTLSITWEMLMVGVV